jgi:glycine C-acetyltransferase
MAENFLSYLEQELQTLKDKGLYKRERVISSAQQAKIQAEGRTVINLCANNYLSLANHPELLKAAKNAVDNYGYGMASVRFICGTLDIHKQLEAKIAQFLGLEDSILYSSCFDANGGLFETLMGPEDAIISDALNHASIIDGIRLAKAQRFRYQNNDMLDLEAKLKESASARYRLIATDGVFSMDGSVARLKEICDLADKYQAMVMIDDSHAVGFMGAQGRGTHELCEVMGRVDIITGTLGKALGGASGGYTAGKKPVIEWLRQRSRPYLFSNTLAPVITATSIKVLDLLQESAVLRERLHENSRYFRRGLEALGFTLLPGQHPIIPVMIGDAALASRMADALLGEGIYVIGFSYPVVPVGQARIRTQMSAELSREQLDQAIAAFAKVGRQLKIIP